MKVLFPVHKAENPEEDKIYLHRDKNGYLRPAMGKDSSDSGKIAEMAFGAHGFTNLIGGVALPEQVVEFYEMEVMQVIPASKASELEVVKIGLKEAQRLISEPRTAINIFLNLAIRMYLDKRLPRGKEEK